MKPMPTRTGRFLEFLEERIRQAGSPGGRRSGPAHAPAHRIAAGQAREGKTSACCAACWGISAEAAERSRRRNEELLQGASSAGDRALASGSPRAHNPLNNISLAAQILARPSRREPAPDRPPRPRRHPRADPAREAHRRRPAWSSRARSPPSCRPAELVAILREAAERASPRGGVAFALEGAPRAPLLADAHLLTQVFRHLIANAADAMGGQGRINGAGRGAARACGSRSPTAGAASTPTTCRRSSTPSSRRRSTAPGSGWAIVYNTVRKHGGTVEVASRVEEGTTFTVTCRRRGGRPRPWRCGSWSRRTRRSASST